MKGLTAVGLAGVLSLGLAGCDGAGSPSVTETPSAEGPPSQTVDIDVSSAPGTRLALADMPTGAPPRVPWIEGETLHVGDRTVVLPRVRTAFVQDSRRVVPYGSGALLELSDYQTWVIVTVDASGHVVRREPGMALASTSDGRIAWWDERAGEAVIADSSGRELSRIPGPEPDPHDPLDVTTIGWLDDEVVFRMGYPGGHYLWSTSGQDLQGWRDEAFATSSAEHLVAAGFWGGTGPDTECTLVWEVGTTRPLWRHCLWRGDMDYSSAVGEFSPDGRLLLVWGGSQTYGARPFHALLDARTGDVVARFDHGRYGSDRVGEMYGVPRFVFEDDHHVLFVVTDRTGQAGTGVSVAIVRCDVEGACELATAPRPYNWQRDGPRWPYDLAR